MKTNPKSHQQTEDVSAHVKRLEEENAQQKATIKWYEEQFRLLQKQRFAPSSEKTADNQMELPLFNEAEVTEAPEVEEPTEEEITYTRKKRQRTSSDAVDQLPVEVVTYELPETDQFCECCDGPVHEMTTETRREIEIVPASAYIKEYRQAVYACRQCESHHTHTPIVKAPMPEPVLFKSMASPSAIAHIMTQKYVEGLPLYRQEKQLARLDLTLSRQTMANWMVKASEQWLEPFYESMKAFLLTQPTMHVDETTVQVLQEKDRAASNQSYMWLYRSGRYEAPCILFDYRTTRASKNPKWFLDGYEGTLHVDGYKGYDGLPHVQLSGCWAHARRKFDEATKAGSYGKTDTPTLSEQGLAYINQLYKLEQSYKEASPEEMLNHRQEHSVPVVDAFYAWAKSSVKTASPKSLLGKALRYAISQEEKLRRPFQDGRLDIDNNRAERSIKPFVIGRKNWLFSQTSKGARASAVIYSVMETAKENQLKPFDYLKYLFETLPNLHEVTIESLEPHLPWSESLPSHIKL
ncbi:IS66 family transposase [Halalkalibacillus halophilus]|uniref:IS66 family transposase n=1 Tax=Halalkalibacillus halophilus TaxID=392827 RepID=UPI0003FA115F|nr:IS66 family transposase [Halalkalibacillus halophilus]